LVVVLREALAHDQTNHSHLRDSGTVHNWSGPSNIRAYQIGYAANLNFGDSAINISNDGDQGGFYPNTLGVGNICVNVYTFDPSEEEVSCCACLVTPNALVSLSAKNDLINNVLTPAIPTSIVIKLVATQPTTAPVTGKYTTCDPGFADGNITRTLSAGMLAWGTTLEPASTPGTYSPVRVAYVNGMLVGNALGTEFESMWQTCDLLQTEGTGYGVCGSCALGALSGTKQ
jgi:hypothetical protein